MNYASVNDAGVLRALDFEIEALEELAAPGWGGWWAGFGVAAVVTIGGVAIGVAVAT